MSYWMSPIVITGGPVWRVLYDLLWHHHLFKLQQEIASSNNPEVTATFLDQLHVLFHNTRLILTSRSALWFPYLDLRGWRFPWPCSHPVRTACVLPSSHQHCSPWLLPPGECEWLCVCVRPVSACAATHLWASTIEILARVRWWCGRHNWHADKVHCVLVILLYVQFLLWRQNTPGLGQKVVYPPQGFLKW